MRPGLRTLPCAGGGQQRCRLSRRMHWWNRNSGSAIVGCRCDPHGCQGSMHRASQGRSTQTHTRTCTQGEACTLAGDEPDVAEACTAPPARPVVANRALEHEQGLGVKDVKYQHSSPAGRWLPCPCWRCRWPPGGRPCSCSGPVSAPLQQQHGVHSTTHKILMRIRVALRMSLSCRGGPANDTMSGLTNGHAHVVVSCSSSSSSSSSRRRRRDVSKYIPGDTIESASDDSPCLAT
jgi:hypothetical protein